jgi:hypothetical protein
VISRNQIKPNTARKAEISEEIEFNFRVTLKARVVQFRSVAIHNDSIELGDHRLKRARVTRTAWSAEMEVTQNERTLRRRRRGRVRTSPRHKRSREQLDKNRRVNTSEIRAETFLNTKEESVWRTVPSAERVSKINSLVQAG